MHRRLLVLRLLVHHAEDMGGGGVEQSGGGLRGDDRIKNMDQAIDMHGEAAPDNVVGGAEILGRMVMGREIKDLVEISVRDQSANGGPIVQGRQAAAPPRLPAGGPARVRPRTSMPPAVSCSHR